jgi:hypothetical protein
MIARIRGVLLAPWFIVTLAIVNVVVFTLSVAIPNDPHPFLDEWGPVSLLSGFQLFAAGLLALEIHKGRPAWLWKLIGWGFFFLCADEMLQIHESSDRVIHWLFGIYETRFTDHLDDLIVGIYGLAGLAALITGRQEMVVFWRRWWIFLAGFICFAMSVVLDFSLTDLSLLQPYFEITSPRAGVWLEVAEEGFKLVGGFCFVAALRKCWEQLQISGRAGSMTAARVISEDGLMR